VPFKVPELNLQRPIFFFSRGLFFNFIVTLKLRWFTTGAQANSSYNIRETIGTWYSWEKRAIPRGALDTLHDRTVISNDRESVGRDQIARHQTRPLVLERSIPRNLHHVKKDSYKGYRADFIVREDTSVHYLPSIVAITLHKILFIYLRKYKTKIQMYIKWTQCNSHLIDILQLYRMLLYRMFRLDI